MAKVRSTLSNQPGAELKSVLLASAVLLWGSNSVQAEGTVANETSTPVTNLVLGGPSGADEAGTAKSDSRSLVFYLEATKNHEAGSQPTAPKPKSSDTSSQVSTSGTKSADGGAQASKPGTTGASAGSQVSNSAGTSSPVSGNDSQLAGAKRNASGPQNSTTSSSPDPQTRGSASSVQDEAMATNDAVAQIMNLGTTNTTKLDDWRRLGDFRPTSTDESFLQITNLNRKNFLESVDSLSSLTESPFKSISSEKPNYANLDLVTAENLDSLEAPNGLVTSDEDVYGSRDDSYIISNGNRMLDSISVCSTPALASAFASLPNCGCAVHPIEAAESVSIKEGTAVVIADRDMEIAVNVGRLKVAQGSVILVSNTKSGTAIYDIHDPGKNSVVLLVGGRSMAISPGRHLLASNEKDHNFASVNALDRISHRRVTTSATADGVIIFASEFSTLAALEAIEPLKLVLTLKHPEARKLANQMIKTSAVLMQLGSNSEDFKYHFKPKMTALVNGAEVTN